MRRKTVILIGFLLSFLIFIGLITFKLSNNQKDKLSIYFFDAGKADAALLYNHEFAVLIDTGEKELGDTIINYLKKHGIDKLDYLIITHFDKDHVGSAYKIIDKIKIDNVIQSNSPKESKVYTKYIVALENKDIEPLTIEDDLTFSFGDVYFTINAPLEDDYVEKASNNSSLITEVKYKNNSFIFMGDAENLRINEYLNSHKNTFDFIKMPYHGHHLSSLTSLIDTVNPKYAVITSSIDEQEDSSTIDLLTKNNVKYYLTRSGAILLESNGATIKIKQ